VDSDFWTRSAGRGILPAGVDQVLPSGWNRFRVDPIAYLDAHHCIEHRAPQANWINGMPLGNGDLGVLAYGAPEALTFSFGKTDLWDYTPRKRPNFPAVPFRELREVLAAQDNLRFLKIQEQTNQKAEAAVATGKPGGMLRLELHPASLTSCFRQRLSFAHAEVVQTWRVVGDRSHARRGPDNSITLMAFVHAARNVFVAHIVPGKDLPWLAPVHLTLWRDWDDAMDQPEYHIEGGRFWVRQNLPGGEHFILMAGLNGNGWEVAKLGGRISVGGVPAAGAWMLCATIVTSRDSKNPLAEAHRNLDAAQAAEFETLRATHREWWHWFWRRGFVCTPWDKLEHAWYSALYLQASCCRPGRMSPGLQSNLIKENYPAWNADFHNNINMQILYWGQYTANRLELGEPLYRLMSDVLPRCKQDTAAYFKMRGARYPISMGPDGLETAPGILLSTWIGGGGWIAEHFWWHYRFSGDREFLKRYAYPLLKECALFYEDYLQEDSDGKLFLFPTVFMEVATYAVAGAGTNSAWDLPVVVRTFQMALAAAEELGVDVKLRSHWRKLLPRLPAMPADERGVWLEFADKGGLWHQWDWARFMAVFPMELVGRDHGPAEWREQGHRTIEDSYAYRKEKAHEAAGFTGAIQATALLRMGHVERGVQMAEYACSQLNPSGFITNPDAYYVQVDAPPGFTVFLNEMLLQSHDGVLRVFPAVPASEGNVCFHSLRAQGAFLVTAERRANRVQYVIVQSLCGNSLRMLNPFLGEPDTGVEVKVYELTADTRFDTVADQARQQAIYDRIHVPGEMLAFPTKPGGVYLISKEIPWFSNIPPMQIE
jgi:alpha-L-fucosidase 2